MILISLVFLFVYLFGAYAYGAATVYSVRQVEPVWGRDRDYAPGVSAGASTGPAWRCSSISTVWFVLHILIEFRNFTGNTAKAGSTSARCIVFLFPPVIMHTVYLESQCAGDAAASADLPLAADGDVRGRAADSASGSIAMIFDWLPRPDRFGPWIGLAIGGLFTLASIYATVLMLQRQPRVRTPDQLRLRNVMIVLFIADEQRLHRDDVHAGAAAARR